MLSLSNVLLRNLRTVLTFVVGILYLEDWDLEVEYDEIKIKTKMFSSTIFKRRALCYLAGYTRSEFCAGFADSSIRKCLLNIFPENLPVIFLCPVVS